MVKIAKTYIPMLLTLLFLLIYFAMIRIVSTDIIITPNHESFLKISLTIIITFIIEWIYFLIKAIKDKNNPNQVLWVILVYMFNVFIIPYYNFKYIINTNNIKLKTTIYVILAIIFSIIGLLLPNLLFSNSKTEQNTLYLKSEKEEIELILHGNYQKKEIGEYDLYANDTIKNINIGVLIYNQEDNVTTKDIHSFRKTWLKNTRKDIKLIDNYEKELNDKKIISNIYSGYKNNINNIYQVSTIVFPNSNYIFEIIAITTKKDYQTNKNELNKILLEARN